MRSSWWPGGLVGPKPGSGVHAPWMACACTPWHFGTMPAPGSWTQVSAKDSIPGPCLWLVPNMAKCA